MELLLHKHITDLTDFEHCFLTSTVVTWATRAGEAATIGDKIGHLGARHKEPFGHLLHLVLSREFMYR